MCAERQQRDKTGVLLTSRESRKFHLPSRRRRSIEDEEAAANAALSLNSR